MPYLRPFIQGYFLHFCPFIQGYFYIFVRLYKVCTLFMNHDIMNAKLFARKDADFAECIECAKHMI